MFKYLYSRFSFYLKRLSLKKVINLLILKISFHLSIWRKKPIMWGKPAFLSIEPTNICNLKCPECPTGGGFSNVKKGYATPELITKLLPSGKESILHINMFFQGEPFLNNSVLEYTRKLSPYTFITVSTNGHFITLKNAKEIIDAGFYKIIVSLDGINQEQYAKYRKGGDFNKVIDSVKLLVSAKKKCKTAFPIIQLQCLLFNYTETIKDKFKSLAKELDVDTVVFKTAQFYNEDNAKAMLPSDSNSRYVIKNDKVEINHEVENRCWRMWNGAVITWNGDVVPCCFDNDKKFVHGNVFATQLFAVWKHPLYVNFRSKILLDRKGIEMCHNCSEK